MFGVINAMLRRVGIDISKYRRIHPGEVIYIIKKIFPPSEPRLAVKRMQNLIATFIKWRYGFTMPNYEIKPIIVVIETVRGCNLNCVMCGAGDLKLRMISFEQFKKITEEFPEAFINILNFIGEPFLSKDIIKMIQHSQKKALPILFSNLTILPNPEELISSGLFELNASIDSFDKQKYDFIRKSGDLKRMLKEIGFNEKRFEIRDRKRGDRIKLEENKVDGTQSDTLERVVKNLKTLIHTKNKLKRHLPIISINSVYAKETREDAEDIIKNAIELGVDRVKFQKLEFDVPGKLHMPDINDLHYLLGLKEKYKHQIEIILANFETGSEIKGYCFHAHFMVVIDIFGNILPCCLSPTFENIELPRFGDIKYKENIEKALKRRQIFINDFRRNPPEFCRKCYLYIRS